MPGTRGASQSPSEGCRRGGGREAGGGAGAGEAFLPVGAPGARRRRSPRSPGLLPPLPARFSGEYLADSQLQGVPAALGSCRPLARVAQRWALPSRAGIAARAVSARPQVVLGVRVRGPDRGARSRVELAAPRGSAQKLKRAWAMPARGPTAWVPFQASVSLPDLSRTLVKLAQRKRLRSEGDALQLPKRSRRGSGSRRAARDPDSGARCSAAGLASPPFPRREREMGTLEGPPPRAAQWEQVSSESK